MNLQRRSFIIGAAGLISVPWVRRAIVPVAMADDASLLCHANMEVSDFLSYEKYGDISNLQLSNSGNWPTISTAQARSGTKSARVYLNRLTSPTSYRTEATTKGTGKHLEFRKTYWWGFSIYVPTNWAISSNGEVLFQLHHQPLAWPSCCDFSPTLALRVYPKTDQWQLMQTYVQTSESQQQQSDLKTAFNGTYGQIAKGRWTDWVFEHRPDWRSLNDGGLGVTRIWRDGTRIVNYTGPNCVNNTYGPYIKFGCYKSMWRDRNHTDPVVERLYYFDDVRVSRPNEGSYESVAPGKDSTTQPMAPQSLIVD